MYEAEINFPFNKTAFNIHVSLGTGETINLSVHRTFALNKVLRMESILNFPPPGPEIQVEKGEIWDLLSKQWQKCMPEEEVRQHLILFLHHHLGYPLSCMVAEKTVTLGKTKKRFDLLVYKQGKPFILCECKAPKVKLGQATLDQIARYNMVMGVPVVLLTNGLQHYVLENKNEEWVALTEIPSY
jgi:hypothetical protein